MCVRMWASELVSGCVKAKVPFLLHSLFQFIPYNSFIYSLTHSTVLSRRHRLQSRRRHHHQHCYAAVVQSCHSDIYVKMVSYAL